MVEIRNVELFDKEFWYELDRHLPEHEFDKKVRDKQGYILLLDGKPIGILRFNLFWDNIPFCTMLYIDTKYHRNGFGKALMKHWEDDMRSNGYDMLLTSTRVDEDSQYFYRKLGFNDCGGLIINIPNHEQPMEMFLAKTI